MQPYAASAAATVQRWGVQAGQAVGRWGQSAWIGATRFFNSSVGQEVTQTAAETALGAQGASPTGIQAAGTVAAIARGTNAAYEAALVGGRHAGMLRNYAGRTLGEVEKAIAGHERQVAEHAEKLANPAAFAERWGQMGAQERAGLLAKWAKDKARNAEMADVLRKLAQSMR